MYKCVIEYINSDHNMTKQDLIIIIVHELLVSDIII